MPSRMSSPVFHAERRRRIWARTAWVVGSVALISGAARYCARAFAPLDNPPCVWPAGSIPVTLKLGVADHVLIDGNTSWDSVASEALAAWNRYLGTAQFSATTQSPGAGSYADHVSQVFFNSTVYGEYLGGLTLAVTTSWHVGTNRTEADVTFNSAITWDSYRGPLRRTNGRLLGDLRRVALHEFGHVLGLDHPDHAGQNVSAIMNSVTHDLDSLTADDIAGARSLYPPLPLALTIQRQSQTPTEVAVCWESLVSHVYQVQFRSSWTDANWTDLGSPVTGDGKTIRVVDSFGGAQHRFYRVVEVP